jgi:aminopeptidase N
LKLIDLVRGSSRLVVSFALSVAVYAGETGQYDAPHFTPAGEKQALPRHYAPDRDAEVLHLALDITPDFKGRSISGEATLTFKPIAKPLVELKLDAVDLSIESVRSEEKIEGYQLCDDHLIITFASAIAAEKPARVSIRYSAQPRKGLYFRTSEMGYQPGDEHLFTQGEAIDTRCWYPGYDSPNEKFTTEITCRVPRGMTVLSNGRLVSQAQDPSGLAVFHWSQDKPHANYLVSLVAGYFKSVEDKYKDIPLALYVPPSDIETANHTFRDTKDVMDFYEHDIGVDFPWAKYYQVIVQDFMEGGMENTSLTTLTENTLFTSATENLRDSDGLISHEMAHQWFGDLVTCKDWSQIWLNEGFATFYATLYDEHKNGRDAMLYHLYGTRRRLVAMTNDTRPIVSRAFEHPDDVFNYLAYQKGSMVLRMLRAQLGEDLYRLCIKTYLQRHQYGNVVTEDLAAVIEELSGRSYDQFFDQWVYHGHYPELEAAYSWDQKDKLAKISIQQNQRLSDEVLLFNFPLKILLKTKSVRVEKTVTVKDRAQDFYFPLSEAPQIVRLDPHIELLAKINFMSLSTAMIDAQLADDSDVAGRLEAVNALKDKTDGASVEKLKTVLNGDPFYGVRIEAAGALNSIHSQESLQALLDSAAQTDARARNQVMTAIAGFYNQAAYEAERKGLSAEKNPDIQAQDIKGIGNYPNSAARDFLVPLLASHSYRNSLADAAISAIRAQDDPSYIQPLRQTLESRRSDFTSAGFAAGLDALAYLARDEKVKAGVREFLLAYVNDKKESVQLGAIKALGTLEDPAAMAVLQTFARSSEETPQQQAAERSLAAIVAARKPADNLKEIRDTILALQKENQKLRKDLDTLEKKLDAKPARPR